MVCHNQSSQFHDRYDNYPHLLDYKKQNKKHKIERLCNLVKDIQLIISDRAGNFLILEV